MVKGSLNHALICFWIIEESLEVRFPNGDKDLPSKWLEYGIGLRTKKTQSTFAKQYSSPSLNQ